MNHLLTELKGQEEKLLNCVHCGFCLPVCPTYSRLGDEADSPRGRLHFMRAVVDGRLDPSSKVFNHHLDRCLGCRACESVCPSGVEYGHLLEGAREVTARSHPKRFLDRVLPMVMARRSLLSPVMALTRALRGTGLPEITIRRFPADGLLGQLRLGLGMVAATASPELLDGRRREVRLPRRPYREKSAVPPLSSTLGKGAATAVLLGCVQEGLLSRVNRATKRVLEANGFRVVQLPKQGCCGAIHAHTGDLEGARALARANLSIFEDAGVEVVAVNAAGCGATMKEYGHLLAQDPEYGERGRAFSEKVKDISELLGRPRLRRGGRLCCTVAYDAPCHLLHAQGVSTEPEFLLDAIPGLVRLPLAKHDECCGGAGVYGITHPELGGAIGKDKVLAILETGADVVATGNPGCMMQIGAGLRIEGARVDVVHPVELLDLSYRIGGIYEND
jgi:glycolate oxidase iron-sulfur subunit